MFKWKRSFCVTLDSWDVEAEAQEAGGGLAVITSCACARLCLTLCGPMNYSPPGSSAQGIFQAIILECVAISYSRRSSRSRDWTQVSCVSCVGRQTLYHSTTWDILLGYSNWCASISQSEWLHFHFSLSCIGEGNGNPLQCYCLENPRDRKPGGLPSMGRTESDTTEAT